MMTMKVSKSFKKMLSCASKTHLSPGELIESTEVLFHVPSCNEVLLLTIIVAPDDGKNHILAEFILAAHVDVLKK